MFIQATIHWPDMPTEYASACTPHQQLTFTPQLQNIFFFAIILSIKQCHFTKQIHLVGTEVSLTFANQSSPIFLCKADVIYRRAQHWDGLKARVHSALIPGRTPVIFTAKPDLLAPGNLAASTSPRCF